MTIATKNIPFRPAPAIPTYAMPWHEYARGKGRCVVPLAKAIGLSADVRSGTRALRVMLQPKGWSGWSESRAFDLRIERVIVQTSFVIEAVTIDDYLADGEMRDPNVDYAHAGEMRPFRVYDVVPRVCRAEAWIAIDVRVDPAASLSDVACVVALDQVAAFGTKVERVALHGNTSGKVYA